jgi:hypothetical protein
MFIVKSPEVQLPPARREHPGWRYDGRGPRRPRTPTEAALLAAELIEGRVMLSSLSVAQALAFTGATRRNCSLARRLTPLDRAAVEAGRTTLNGAAKRRRTAGLADPTLL